jgi:pSer/pThr/pTyr-binding forkhead associated (FHA) protein
MGAAAERIPASELMAQVPRLVSLPGEPVREYRLLNKRVIIGSGGEADFVLLDQTVARKHAQIIKRHNNYLLVDLGSPHGTFLNRRKLTPNTEYPLSSACDVQIGTLHFTFMLPSGAQDAMRASLNRSMRTQGLVTVLLLVSIVLSYIVPRSFWESLIPHRSTRIVPVLVSDTWIASLNHFRETAGLSPVRDAKALSAGVANHAHYVVVNDAAMIRAGKIDASIHDEDPSKPFFTPDGKAAGALSDVDAVFTDPPAAPESSWAIENWITGPFHRMWLLNPALHEVGYGQFCSGGICAAALNVRSGMDADPGRAAPVMYPSDRDTIRNGTFSADETEWPDPLATCGYHTPTGVPISLQIGGSAPAGLETASLTRNGAAVTTCAFDATSYKSADPVAQDRVRKELAHFAAIVMVPREPLVPGATYSVNIKAGGQNFSWWFAVEP